MSAVTTETKRYRCGRYGKGTGPSMKQSTAPYRSPFDREQWRYILPRAYYAIRVIAHVVKISALTPRRCISAPISCW
jgi:hypothetical protein